MGVDLPKDKLVLGSAGKFQPDEITLDIDSEHQPDVVHDLHVVPLPFDDHQFKS